MAELNSPYGNNPRSLAASNPNGAAEANAQDAYANVASDASALDKAYANVGAEAGGQGPQVTQPEPQEQQGMAGKALDVAGRALDYGGGMIRTGLAEVAGLASGKPDTVTTDDLKNAAKGRAPLSAEYLRRLGVPEGGSMNLPGLGRVTTRGAAGLAADIATDPLTAITKLAKEVPYIGRLINAPGLAAEAAGEAVYKSAFKKIDAKLAEKGQDALSPILMEQGITGSTKNIAKQVEDMSNTMGKIRQGLYTKADQAGAMVNLTEGFDRAEKVIERMKSNPGLAPAAAEFETLLNSYKNAGQVPISLVSDWKTQLYDALPKTAFDSFGKVKGQAMQFKSALAGDFRQKIVESGNKAEKGLGDAINVLNEKWGTLLNAQKPLGQQAKSAAGSSLGNWVDGILLGANQIPALILKKSMDLASTTAARTVAGKALMQAGQNGIAGALSRKAAIEAQRAYQEHQQNFSPAVPQQTPDTGQSMGQQINEVNQGTPVAE